MRTYEISGIRNASGLARKLARHGYDAISQDGLVYATGERRPWAVCNGYCLVSFCVREIATHTAPQRLRDLLPATGEVDA